MPKERFPLVFHHTRLEIAHGIRVRKGSDFRHVLQQTQFGLTLNDATLGQHRKQYGSVHDCAE
jgi:hypothetical protein